MLGFFQKLLSSADGQQDGFGVAAIVKTQVDSSLKVPNQERLAYQAVRILDPEGTDSS